MSSKPDTNKPDRADPAVVAKVMAAPDVTPPAEQPAVSQPVRFGRRRVGGSTLMHLLIQRARFPGHPMMPLDGDLRSGTLAAFYPAHATDGSPIPDRVSMPGSDETMTRDGILRVIDLGGGERVIHSRPNASSREGGCTGEAKARTSPSAG